MSIFLELESCKVAFSCECVWKLCARVQAGTRSALSAMETCVWGHFCTVTTRALLPLPFPVAFVQCLFGIYIFLIHNKKASTLALFCCEFSNAHRRGDMLRKRWTLIARCALLFFPRPGARSPHEKRIYADTRVAPRYTRKTTLRGTLVRKNAVTKASFISLSTTLSPSSLFKSLPP